MHVQLDPVVIYVVLKKIDSIGLLGFHGGIYVGRGAWKCRSGTRFFWAELEAYGGTLFFAASKEVVFAAGGRLPTSRNKSDGLSFCPKPAATSRHDFSFSLSNLSCAVKQQSSISTVYLVVT
ncbi:hypothetical protein PVAP13_7KG111165 [Panicum virgatum]|uniref:Uncharacterized protein n=1 Tax=Panicum virgatum TaxID=38727 RepID=A0A8T0QC08_PANVG|nr:hypothetical protein PVAP13_7KG111165 [Panicum virgatum]